MASYTVSSTNVTITFKVSNVAVGTSIRYFVRYADDTSSSVIDADIESTSSPETVTFDASDGLKANTDYTVNVQVSYPDWLGAKDITTGEEMIEDDDASFTSYSETTTDDSDPKFRVYYSNSLSRTVYLRVCVDYEQQNYWEVSSGTSANRTIHPFNYDTFSTGTYDVDFYLSSSSTGDTNYDHIKFSNVYYEGTTRYYFTWTSNSLVASKPSSNLPISVGDSLSTYLTAVKWTVLQEAINNVRECLGYRDYSFTEVSAGMEIKADYYNECIDAIAAISSYNADSYYVESGQTITASCMNVLQSMINNIST